MRNFASTLDNRMFDFKSHYDRLAVLVPNNCRIVECGLADGASAIYLCEAILNLGKTIDKFFWVDSMSYGKYNQMKTIYENLIKSGLGEYVEVIPLDSVKAAKKFNGNSMDMVFLDSSHDYKETKKEIVIWYDKLKPDGILSGHDFFSEENPGVQKAVRELLPEIIKRATINQPTQYQEFPEETFLFTEQTERNCGVYWVTKRFYYTVK